MNVRVELPNSVRCAIAITYDTDMAGGYAPNGVCHGRTGYFLMDYTMMLCETAEDYGVSLHFFQISNGLEGDDVVSHLRKVIRRGHVVDFHTYNHVSLTLSSPEELHHDLNLANQLFEGKLGFRPVILRGPGGYRHGDLRIENQLVIQKTGINGLVESLIMFCSRKPCVKGRITSIWLAHLLAIVRSRIRQG